MSDTNTQLDNLDTLQSDTEVATESLLAARATMVSVEDIVTAAIEKGGLSDDAAQLMQVITDHVAEQIDAPEPIDLGLESLEYSDRLIASDYALAKVRTTLESIDSDLQVSTEGLFDIFRSQNTKNKNWIEETRKELTDLKTGIVRSDSKDIQVKGITRSEGYLEGTDRSLRELATILNDHGTTVLSEAKELAKVAERLRNGNTNYQQVSNVMRGVRITGPGGKREYNSGLLLGGNALRLFLSEGKSQVETEKDKESVTVNVTGENAITAIDDALKLLTVMSKAVAQNDKLEKEVDSASDKGTSKAILYGFFFGEYANYSPDFNRRVRRIWGRDKQDAKSKEVRCSFGLIKQTMTAARAAVEEIIRVAKKF